MLQQPPAALPFGTLPPVAGGPSSNAAVAASAGMVYVNDDEPGIRRRRVGKGFSYYGPDGKRITDPQILARIKHLAIPPAYTGIWICTDPNGHIQATARDDRGRKQYRYHERWREIRDETKYARMAAFGRALPALRARIDSDLRRHGFPKQKVVAAVVRLLELSLLRVGNDEYARDNNSFGLTTLRHRHVRFEGPELVFAFRGKSGVQHLTRVRDRRLAHIVRAVHELPGQRLFQYIDENGERQPIGSGDVNEYLQEVTGENFTAKDFRTWAGTIAAAKALAMQPVPQSKAEAKRLTTLCVKATAGLLGNTPAVCRASYIHPGVLEAFADGRLPADFAHAEGEEYERAVLNFLDTLAEDVEERTGLTLRQQLEASLA